MISSYSPRIICRKAECCICPMLHINLFVKHSLTILITKSPGINVSINRSIFSWTIWLCDSKLTYRIFCFVFILEIHTIKHYICSYFFKIGIVYIGLNLCIDTLYKHFYRISFSISCTAKGFTRQLSCTQVLATIFIDRITHDKTMGFIVEFRTFHFRTHSWPTIGSSSSVKHISIHIRIHYSQHSSRSHLALTIQYQYCRSCSRNSGTLISIT